MCAKVTHTETLAKSRVNGGGNANRCQKMYVTYIDLYIFSPDGPTFWFCRRVLTKSSGNTHVTPMMPAMPPLMTFGRSLSNGREWD